MPGSSQQEFFEKVQREKPEAKGKEKAEEVKEQKRKLHEKMDERFEAKRRAMEKAKQQKDTTRMWQLWSKAVEEGFLEFFDQSPPQG